MMDVDQYDEGGDMMHPTTEMEDPYATAHTVYDDELNLDEMPVTQEDAWAVIRSVFVSGVMYLVLSCTCCYPGSMFAAACRENQFASGFDSEDLQSALN
jgi:hypothetical protein